MLNTELKPELNEGAKTACEHYGITFVKLENISKLSGHPSREGMTQIKDQIIKTCNF